jgi:hypothetical protein
MAEREPPPVNGEGGPVRQPWRADHSSTDARVLHWGGDISGRVVPLLASMRRMAGDAAHPGGGGRLSLLHIHLLKFCARLMLDSGVLHTLHRT